MKIIAIRLPALAAALVLALAGGAGTERAAAQGGPFMGMGNGPRFDGHMAKLFGPHQNFTCALEVEAKPSERPDGVSIPGRLSYAEGKSRLEMDLTRMSGGMMPAAMLEQIKALGMAEMAIVSKPADGSTMLIYPGLKSYAPIRSGGAKAPAPDEYKLASTELGKEAIDGNECVKNQVTVTAPDGKKFEATVWNAAGLKNFPVKIQSQEGGVPFTLSFKNVKFEKPAAALFENPASFSKYEDPSALMRDVIIKKMGAGAGGK